MCAARRGGCVFTRTLSGVPPWLGQHAILTEHSGWILDRMHTLHPVDVAFRDSTLGWTPFEPYPLVPLVLVIWHVVTFLKFDGARLPCDDEQLSKVIL